MCYLIVFFILLILAILEMLPQNKINNKILIGLAWGMLVLFAGLRYETGGDWNLYQNIMNEIPPVSKLLSAEKTRLISLYKLQLGFVFLCSVLKQLGLGVQVLFFLVTLFNVTLITKSLSHYTKYVVTALLAYYSVVYLKIEFAMIRQAIAASICFFSFRYIQERKMWKYLVLVLIAFSFHISALIMLPLYFFLNIRLSNKLLISMLVVGCAIMLFHISWFSQSLLFITEFLGSSFFERAVYYTSDEILGADRLISLEFVLNIFLFSVFLCYRKQLDAKKYGNLFLNVFMSGIVIYYYFYESITMSYRLRLYFLYAFMVLFPYLIEVFNNYVSSKKIAFMAVLVFCCSAFNGKIYLNMPPPSILYNPYQNYIVYKTLGKESLGEKRLLEHFEKMKEETEKNVKDTK